MMFAFRLGALVALLTGAVACTGSSEPPSVAPRANTHAPGSRDTHDRPQSDALARRQIILGYSVDHRPITAIEQGDPDSPRRALIVGCIHGNEPAGIDITNVLTSTPVPPELDLWIVPDVNPDGVYAHTRGNAHGVDLNRNFPYLWRPITASGSSQYAGPRPLSEPESKILASLLNQVRPTLGIWYHQALTVVDSSQGPFMLERRYAAATGLPLRRLPDYPGSAVGLEDHLFGPSAFVVELPGGTLTRAQVMRHVSAVLDIATRS